MLSGRESEGLHWSRRSSSDGRHTQVFLHLDAALTNQSKVKKKRVGNPLQYTFDGPCATRGTFVEGFAASGQLAKNRLAGDLIQDSCIDGCAGTACNRLHPTTHGRALSSAEKAGATNAMAMCEPASSPGLIPPAASFSHTGETRYDFSRWDTNTSETRVGVSAPRMGCRRGGEGCACCDGRPRCTTDRQTPV